MKDGRYLTLWCRLFGHAEPMWAVGPLGRGWRCPDCQRFRVSRVLKELA